MKDQRDESYIIYTTNLMYIIMYFNIYILYIYIYIYICIDCLSIYL